jgi:multidrug efflux system membrane fusion protein
MKPDGIALPLAALAAALALSGCAGDGPRRAQRIPITVAIAEKRSVPYEIEATGTVEAMQSAQVTAQVNGLVTRVAFREGDRVRAGQVLFQIDPRPFEAAAERAAAVLARDRAQAETARLELDRANALAQQQLIATGELDQKRSSYAALAATARADSAALATARLDVANATLRAPISGTTGAQSVHVGDLVRANDNTVPLVTINQIQPILVRFTVPQADLAALRRQRSRATRVDVASSETDSVWTTGRLVFVDNQVDAASGTVLLKAEFPNRDGALWPGEFVRVRLRLFDQADATVVPAVAISGSQSGTYLYVVKADTTVENRPVVVSRTWRDLSVIAEGVKPGEVVVTDGQVRLSPGAKGIVRTGAAAIGSPVAEAAAR